MQRANGTDYFPSVTMGAMRRSCIYGLDYWPTYPPPSTVGRWEYRIDATGPFVTYNDPDAAHPLDGYSYRFVDADCAVRRINGQGDWVDITLGDL